MIPWLMLIVFISVYEINNMNKKKLYKERAVFILFAILAVIMSYYYSKNPYGISISEFVLNLLGYDL